MTTIAILLAAFALGIAGLIWWPRLANLMTGPAPTQDDEPDETDDRPDSGADEEFGAELRAMRDGEVSPELISDVEVELRWGLVWHDFEHAMQAEIDRAFAPVLDELQRPRSFDELRELVCPRELVAA